MMNHGEKPFKYKKPKEKRKLNMPSLNLNLGQGEEGAAKDETIAEGGEEEDPQVRIIDQHDLLEGGDSDGDKAGGDDSEEYDGEGEGEDSDEISFKEDELPTYEDLVARRQKGISIEEVTSVPTEDLSQLQDM